jgi:hypothetical protein
MTSQRVRLDVRGRDGPSPGEARGPIRLGPPPAQIPASVTNALGSCIGSRRQTAVRARDAGYRQGEASVGVDGPCESIPLDHAGCDARVRVSSDAPLLRGTPVTQTRSSFLASDDSSYITGAGVIRGWRSCPSVDRRGLFTTWRIADVLVRVEMGEPARDKYARPATSRVAQ